MGGIWCVRKLKRNGRGKIKTAAHCEVESEAIAISALIEGH